MTGDEVPGRAGRARRVVAVALGVLLALAAGEVLVRVRVARSGWPGGAVEEADEVTNRRVWLERPRQRVVDLGEQYVHDPELGWRPAPDLRDFTPPGHPPISTNALGMRGARDYPPGRTEGVPRVLLVGDSFTFGTDQPDGRVWSARLEARLANTHGDAEVLNAGVPGYGTGQAWLMLRERLELAPDVVVWGIFVGNPKRAASGFTFYAKPHVVLEDGELVVTGTPVPGPEELAAQHASPHEWGGDAEDPPSYLLAWLARAGRAGGEEEPGLQPLHRALLADAARACDEVGARLVVVDIPGAGWRGARRTGVQRALPRWAEELGFLLLDFREALEAAEAEAPDAPLYLPGKHLTPRGNAVLARAVEAVVEPLLSP